MTGRDLLPGDLIAADMSSVSTQVTIGAWSERTLRIVAKRRGDGAFTYQDGHPCSLYVAWTHDDA